MSNNSISVAIDLAAVFAPQNTFVLAYLKCKQKEPSEFLKILGDFFQRDEIKSKTSQKILDNLADAWTKKVTAEPILRCNPCAPHAFIGVMKEHGIWQSKLPFEDLPQKSP